MSLDESTEITVEDLEALRGAVKSLEHPSLAARLTNLVGKPVELVGYALPSFVSHAGGGFALKRVERRPERIDTAFPLRAQKNAHPTKLEYIATFNNLAMAQIAVAI